MGWESMSRKFEAHVARYGQTPNCFTYTLDVLTRGGVGSYELYAQRGPIPVEMETTLESLSGGLGFGVYSGSLIRRLWGHEEGGEMNDLIVQETTDALFSCGVRLGIATVRSGRKSNHITAYTGIGRDTVLHWDSQKPLATMKCKGLVEREIRDCMNDSGGALYTVGFVASLNVPK